MAVQDYDLVIIGGGPGGYTAAIRAAQLGMKVCAIEKSKVGGICLNEGCIPTKALHRSAEVFSLMKRSEEFGVSCADISLDWATVQARKLDITSKLTDGVSKLLKANGVDLVQGTASIGDSGKVAVKIADGEQLVLNAQKILIATGASSTIPKIPGVDLPGVMDSKSLMSIEELPDSLVVVGGGVVGMELATIFNTFGCRVTVLEAAPEILGPLDSEFKKRLKPILKKQGLDIRTNVTISEIKKDKDGLAVMFAGDTGEVLVNGSTVLMAAGRTPNTEALNLAEAGVQYDRTGIKTNSVYQTSNPDIYAVGDVTGGVMLAHTAAHAGLCAVEHMAGTATCMTSMASVTMENPYTVGAEKSTEQVVPACIFLFPEIAYAGITEEAAKQRNISYKIGKFMFGANGKALASGEGEGLVKLIADENEVIIGITIMGPHASDLIHEGALAIKEKCSAKDLAELIHAHPTLGEVIHEASLNITGYPIHTAPSGRNRPESRR